MNLSSHMTHPHIFEITRPEVGCFLSKLLKLQGNILFLSAMLTGMTPLAKEY